MVSDGPVADRFSRLRDRPGEDVGRDPNDVAARSLREQVEAAGERLSHVRLGDDEELVRGLLLEEPTLPVARAEASTRPGIALSGEPVVDDATGVERRAFDGVAAPPRGPQESERTEASDPYGFF